MCCHVRLSAKETTGQSLTSVPGLYLASFQGDGGIEEGRGFSLIASPDQCTDCRVWD